MLTVKSRIKLIIMLIFSFFYLFLIVVSTERPLLSYAKEEGQAPDWLPTEDAKKKAAVERWYIDTADATCKPFTYLGSLGNFNNFVSKAACDGHLKFTPEEQGDACESNMEAGSCGLSGTNMLTRWYFKAGSHDNKANACHSFKYNGCGGNANNFKTELECQQACQNKKNGKVGKDVADNTLTAIPNLFDCKFSPEVKTSTPMMKIIPHKDGKKCVYAAVGKDATRGFFDDLPNCVNTCIKPLVAACAADGPHQVSTSSVITSTNDVEIFYYFNQGKKLCLPFMSKAPAEGTSVNDGALNIFKSVEMCASFCPAINHIGQQTAVKACELPKFGVSDKSTDKYQIIRYFYDHADKTATEKCKEFEFNGKNMNLNNFKDLAECKAMCSTPLTPG